MKSLIFSPFLLFVPKFCDWLEAHQQSCFSKRMFGISCALCGVQRGFLLLLRGHPLDAILQFPPMLAWFLTLVFCVGLKIKGAVSQKAVEIILWVNLAVMLLNAVYQNLFY